MVIRHHNDPLYDPIAIARGEVNHGQAVHKFGRNSDVDTAEDVWDSGGTFIPIAAAERHTVVSDNAQDDTAGTGARTVRVFGLVDWDSQEVSEVVSMNGTSAVNTANDYIMINRLFVETAGVGGVNAGNITITPEFEGSLRARITALAGQTQMAVYGFPSKQDFYMTRYYAGINRASNGACNITLLYNPAPDTNIETFLVRETTSVSSTGSSYVARGYDIPNKFQGPGLLKVQADPSTVNLDISAGFDGVLFLKGA